ncbi:MAG: peroxiredoxin [Xanthomonadales bacterium]|nr:peroxiredoxin [Xanthomonadales bacterium]
MIQIGEKLPPFRLKAVIDSEPARAFAEIGHDSYPGQWLCLLFYPKDFTFVCPTELKGFAELEGQFRERGCQLLACSTDSEFVHLAWRRSHEHLRELPFPMLSDLRRELSVALGILDPAEGVAQRATFLVDPAGVVRFVYVTDLNVGRSPQEVLRVLDALQTEELCPCNWQPGTGHAQGGLSRHTSGRTRSPKRLAPGACPAGARAGRASPSTRPSP